MIKIKKPIIISLLTAITFCGLSFTLIKTERNFDEVSADASDYYSSVDTSTAQKLMETLETRLNKGAVDLGYDGLWSAYPTTDVKPGTNILWDMYSNESYTTTDSRINKNYSKEGDSVNREHSIPQSWFNEAKPMKSDLFHVYPTDGYVNNRRSNYPHGKVGSATYTSKNGSKLGNANFPGYSGKVFEPIDEYKGDFARTYFYMATRYGSKVGSWSGEVFTGSFPFIQTAFKDLYYSWHLQDPVSEKEINRNDAAFLLQKNRNPYIDHPEWADYIFKGIAPGPQKKLVSLTSEGSPTIKDYYVGETFNPAGLTITAHFDDSTTMTVTNLVSWPAFTSPTSSITGSYTYNGVQKPITITGLNVVERPTPVVKTLVSLESSGTPNKTVYNIGETFNPAGLTITAHFSDGSSNNVTNEVVFPGFTSKVTTVTGSYTYNSVTKTILITGLTVNDGRVIPVSEIKLSAKDINVYVDSIVQINSTVLPEDATDKTLTYSSSDSKLATVDSTGLVVMKKAGNVTITATAFNDVKGEINFTINDRSLVEIVAKSLPYKCVYEVNEKYSRDGLIIEAHYLDGSKELVTAGYSVDDQDVNTKKAGDYTVNVQYRNMTLSYTVTVLESVIKSIKITKLPAKTTYFRNESFSKIGLVVEATCENGSVLDVSDKVTFDYDFSVDSNVDVLLNDLSTSLEVTLENGEPTNEHKAADFTYVFGDKLQDLQPSEIKNKDWKILEYNYNQLDEGAKDVLKNISGKSSTTQVAAAEDVTDKLQNCIYRYDEIVLARKTDGFNDFMSRNPKQPTPPANVNMMIFIIIGVVLFVLIIVFAVILPICIHKHHKKTAKNS